MQPQTLLLLAAGAAARLDTLLFYTCVTPQVGNQCEEGFTLDQMGTTTAAFSQNFSTIAAGKARGNVSSLYAVHDVFFANGEGLAPGWEAAWAALKEELVPWVENGTVTGCVLPAAPRRAEATRVGSSWATSCCPRASATCRRSRRRSRRCRR